MVFVPLRKEQFVKSRGLSLPQLHDFEETPIYTALHVIGQQLFGWLYYLSTNVTGHNHHSRQPEGKGKGKTNGPMGGVNHFLPSSPLFEKRDERLILLSDLGLLITGTVLYKLGQSFGWTNMLVWYFIPYLWVNHWLGKYRLSLSL